MNKKNFQLKINEAEKLILQKRFDLFKIGFGDDIRVFSEPKTGSTTLQNLINTPWHLHYHSFKSLINLAHINKHNNNFWKVHLATYFFTLIMKIKTKIFRKEIKILSTIRNPSDRIASSFFFNFEYYMLKFRSEHVRAITNYFFSHDEIIEYIFDQYIDSWEKIYKSYDYFDSEIKRLTGIDVYKLPFDKQKGFGIYKKGRFTLMIVDCYKISELTNEIEDFVGYEIDLAVSNMNSSNDKWYREIYKRIYNQSKREEIGNKFSKMKYFKHFYNED